MTFYLIHEVLKLGDVYCTIDVWTNHDSFANLSSNKNNSKCSFNISKKFPQKFIWLFFCNLHTQARASFSMCIKDTWILASSGTSWKSKHSYAQKIHPFYGFTPKSLENLISFASSVVNIDLYPKLDYEMSLIPGSSPVRNRLWVVAPAPILWLLELLYLDFSTVLIAIPLAPAWTTPSIIIVPLPRPNS